jgi:hypothetical protein
MKKIFYYEKLKRLYNLVVRVYANFLLNNPISLILIYSIITLLLNFGLFSVKVNSAQDSLSFVRDSQALVQARRLAETFTFDQHKRHFSNQLLTMGHYVEIIVTRRLQPGRPQTNSDLLKPEFNLINESLLAEYNQLFDSILDLEIEDEEEEEAQLLGNNNETTIKRTRSRIRKMYKYKSDLCAKRFEKCAIEGGVSRAKSFQGDLLKGAIDYYVNDPKVSYASVEEMDGVNMDLLFGKYRLEKTLENSRDDYFGDKHAIIHAAVLRARFDLLATSEREKHLAVKFMHRFAEHMGKLEADDVFKNLNVSYHASHLLEHEIIKYSLLDLKFLALTLAGVFVLVWISMCWFVGLNFSIRSVCVQSASCLPFIVIIQFVLIVTSTFGACSLLKIESNQLCFGVILIVLGNFKFWPKPKSNHIAELSSFSRFGYQSGFLKNFKFRLIYLI